MTSKPHSVTIRLLAAVTMFAAGAGVATVVELGSRGSAPADAAAGGGDRQLYADVDMPSPPSGAPSWITGSSDTGSSDTGSSDTGSWTPDSSRTGDPETHGVERPPAGVDLRRRPGLDELRGRRLVHRPAGRGGGAEAATAPGEVSTTGTYDVACVGDGSSGKRVLAIYARAIDVADRSAELVPLIRQYAADADFRINRSAAESGEGRRVRYVTRPLPDGCEVDVRVVTLSLTGDDTFSNTRSELAAQGFNVADRKYLVWVDAAVGICGLGQFYRDSTAGPGNRNNGGPMYARVDAPCWGYAETHELLHTLGAVQASSQHATAAGHCTDENDVMCYSDADGVVMHAACADAPAQWVDCGLDDYFNADPPAGSYLASNWNVADSAFLEGAPAPPEPPRVVVTSPDSMLAGTTVAANATVTVPEGRTFSIAWSTTRAACSFSQPNTVTTSFSCPATLAGEGQVTASVVDSAGLAWSHTRNFSFTVRGSPRTTALTAATSSSSVAYGDRVTLSARLVDASTGQSVIGMPVVVYGITSDATWRQLASATTAGDGRLAVTLAPATTTTYVVMSASTSTWASATSPELRVAVGTATTGPTPEPVVVPPSTAPPAPVPGAPVPPPGVVPRGVSGPGTAARPAVNRTIRLTRVQYNAPGADGRANLNGEYLRLKNTGSSAVTLTGWRVRSAAGATYTFGATRLRAGASITLFTGRGTPTSAARFWGRNQHAWRNSGRDSATLRDEYARTVNSCSWTARARGYAAC